MIALFDTNIYIDGLTGRIQPTQFELWRSGYIIRLSPVVYHELLRGAREPSVIHEIRDKTIMLVPPSSRMWEKSAELIRQFADKFGISEGIHKLQNDFLIALSARNIGAFLITHDKHFEQIQTLISFNCLIHKSI